MDWFKYYQPPKRSQVEKHEKNGDFSSLWEPDEDVCHKPLFSKKIGKMIRSPAGDSLNELAYNTLASWYRITITMSGIAAVYEYLNTIA